MRPQSKVALIGLARRVSDRLPVRLANGVQGIGRLVVDGRGERKSLSRQVQYELLRRATPVLVAPFGAGQLLVDAGDHEIGRTVYVTGGYERWHMEAAVGRLRAAGRDPAGRLFVDVGANIGTSTVDALVHFGFGTAVCFEPAAGNVRLLRANLLWNGLDDRAVVHQVAVSDSDGTGVLQRSETNSGDHRFTTGVPVPVPGHAPVAEPVDCRRLDSYVEAGAIDPSDIGLLWIDAQGHEPNVLRGARTMVAAKVPVVLEYCPWILPGSTAALDAEIARSCSSLVRLDAAAAIGADDDEVMTPDDLPALARRLGRRGYADLLLLP